jgi:hypothetical protein
MARGPFSLDTSLHPYLYTFSILFGIYTLVSYCDDYNTLISYHDHKTLSVYIVTMTTIISYFYSCTNYDDYGTLVPELYDYGKTPHSICIVRMLMVPWCRTTTTRFYIATKNIIDVLMPSSRIVYKNKYNKVTLVIKDITSILRWHGRNRNREKGNRLITSS